MSNPSNRASMRGQLTLRGVVIGVLGCMIITAKREEGFAEGQRLPKHT